MRIADTNQPRTTIQRDAAGDNSTRLSPTAWTSLLNAMNWVAKWLYIGIEWPKDINFDAFARRTVTASDSTCPPDGVSLAIFSHAPCCNTQEKLESNGYAKFWG